MCMISFAKGSYFMKAPVIRASSFGDHVRHIVLLGAKKQMRRIYARGVIAAMKHLYSFGDRFGVMQFPGDAMGKFILPMLPASIQHPIAMMDFAPRPEPAPFRASRLVNLGPKPLFDGDTFGIHDTLLNGDTRSLGGSCLGNQRGRQRVSYKMISAWRIQFPRQPQYITSWTGGQA